MPVSAEMIAHLAGSAVLCSVISITEILPDGTDGDVVRVTDHTRNLVVDSNEYISIIIDASQIQQTSGLEADNLEITTILNDAFSSQMLRNKKWYGARVDFARYNPVDVTMGPALRRVCRVGQAAVSRYTAKAELRTRAQLLDQPVGDLVTPYSLTELGDARCKIDLNSQTVDDYEITMTATVVDVIDRQVFECALDGEIKTGEEVAPDDFYKQGRCVFTSGNNTGAEFKIITNVAGAIIGPPQSNLITLWLPTNYDISLGDTLTLIAGCDKTRAQCRDKFDNVINFRGFPDVPGPDKVFAIPETPNA